MVEGRRSGAAAGRGGPLALLAVSLVVVALDLPLLLGSSVPAERAAQA